MYVFFFFQAEDGIRDVAVTGVQTCALPISFRNLRKDAMRLLAVIAFAQQGEEIGHDEERRRGREQQAADDRSEERRVGKECRARRGQEQGKQKEVHKVSSIDESEKPVT